MPFDNSHTYTIGEIVTAAIMKTYIKDNLNETAPAKVTTAGDIIYATAANAIARLGIGTAGQILRTNSGATAPEWINTELLSSLLTPSTFETSATSFTDATGTSATLSPLRAGTIVALVRATLDSNNAEGSESQLLIDGNVYEFRSVGTGPASSSITCMAFHAVTAGSYVCKMQLRCTGGFLVSVKLSAIHIFYLFIPS